MKGYRLRIKQLKYISAVDAGAQGPVANVALIKRTPQAPRRTGMQQPPRSPVEVQATCTVTKVDAALGLVFGWAMAGTTDGGKTDHVDLQADAIEVNSTDFIKACADYIQAGAASDVMHNERTDGRVVFAMPLVKEVNDALGIKSDVEGLAIAMKPSPETFKRFLSGELAAFSIGGYGERTPLPEQKRAEKRALFSRVVKEAVLTSEENGHAHTIDLDDPSRYWCDQLQTSFQTEEGATAGHSHAWVFDAATGEIIIAADSGHTHTLTDAVVPADVLAAYAARDAQRDAENLAMAAAPQAIEDEPSDGVCAPVIDEESSGKVQVVVVQAGAPKNKSTQGAAAKQGGSRKSEIIQMNIAKLLAAFLAMTPAQLSFVEKLAPDELDGFFGKPAGERETLAKAALDADPVVFKGELTGLEVRKSHGEVAIKTAEQAEKLAKKNRDLEGEIAVSKAAREIEILKSRAKSELGHLAGTEDDKVAALRAVDAIADEKVREGVIKMLKGADAIAKTQTKAPGYGGEANTVAVTKRDTYEALKKGLTAFCIEKNLEKVWTDGLDAFVKTDAGRALYDAHEAAKQAEAK